MVNRRIQLATICCVSLLWGSDQAVAQLNRPLEETEGVDVTEHLDDYIPLDAVFTDDRGKRRRLQSFFSGDKPVILSMNYSNCPMLCSTQLNGLVDALKEIELTAGTDFQIVSVSIDPRETTARARETQQKYTKLYGRAGESQGWHFLTGEVAEIDRVAQSIGFGYKYVPAIKEYAHPAVFVLCTPDGRISRYLYNVFFPPQTVRLSLVEAADGKIGTTLDKVILTCFAYNPQDGKYSPTVIGIMKVGAGLTVLGLALLLIPVWLKRRPSKVNTDSDSTALKAV